MGFLDGLFGRSRDRKPVASDRCMDCGTAGGSHTDWCPSAEMVAPQVTPASPPTEVSSAEVTSTEDARDEREDTPGP